MSYEQNRKINRIFFKGILLGECLKIIRSDSFETLFCKIIEIVSLGDGLFYSIFDE